MGKKKKYIAKKDTKGFNFKQWLIVEEKSIYTVNHSEIMIAIFVFLTAFFSYLKTLTPTVGFHDSGDMIVASSLLGIPHPPGYPLYCLIGNLFSLIPIGNIAYRFNMMSALVASLTVMMVYIILLKLRLPFVSQKDKQPFIKLFIQYIPIIATAFIFCWTKTFWEQAVIAEKYTLNGLFLTVLIFILLKWQEATIEYKNSQSTISQRCYLCNPQFCFCLFALILGLSFTHHLQTIFLVPAALYLILVANWQGAKKLLKSDILLLSAVLFFLPMCLYFYLLIRAKAAPLANWGDPSNISRLIEHVTAKSYSGFFSMDTIFKNLFSHITQFFPSQFTFILLLVGLFGGFILLMKRKQFFIFFAIILLADITHSIRYNIPNIEDYYIPGFLVFSIWIGYGLMGLMEIISNKKPSVITFTSVIFLSLSFIPLSVHYSHNNRSNYYLAYDSAMNILNQLEEKAIIITKGDDDLFPVWYLQYIENIRLDVSPFNMILFQHKWHMEQLQKRHPYLDLEIEPKTLIQTTTPDNLDDLSRTRLISTVERNYRKIPTYSYYINALSHGYCLVPEAILCRVLPEGTNGQIQYQQLETNKDWLKYRRGLLTKGIKDRRGLEVIKTYGMTYSNRATTYLNLGMMDKAIFEFERGVEIDPSSADLHYNLGALYANSGRKQDAIGQFEEAINAQPNHLSAKEALDRLKK